MRAWFLQVAPILASLRKHRLSTLLIALEVALACAVLCNAFSLIANRIEMIRIPSGVDEDRLGIIVLRGCTNCNLTDLNARVTRSLMGLTGVESVSIVNTVPFGTRRGDMGVRLSPDTTENSGIPHFYTGGPGTTDTMGLQLRAGRKFQPEDFQTTDSWIPRESVVWITQAFAEHLWQGSDPLGRDFWAGKSHFRVVGVMSHLARPNPGGRGPQTADWSVFVPVAPGKSLAGTYLIRAEAKDLAHIMQEAKSVILKTAPDVVLDYEQSRTVKELRHQYFDQDRAMSNILVSISVAMLVVTAIGIIGLASFWVTGRKRQIGVRRALGATSRDILVYFQLENFLIVASGSLIGIVLAYGINFELMSSYEAPRIPVYYPPTCAMLLILLGQVAAWAPALKASRIQPVSAIRSI